MPRAEVRDWAAERRDESSCADVKARGPRMRRGVVNFMFVGGWREMEVVVVVVVEMGLVVAVMVG